MRKVRNVWFPQGIIAARILGSKEHSAEDVRGNHSSLPMPQTLYHSFIDSKAAGRRELPPRQRRQEPTKSHGAKDSETVKQ